VKNLQLDGPLYGPKVSPGVDPTGSNGRTGRGDVVVTRVSSKRKELPGFEGCLGWVSPGRTRKMGETANRKRTAKGPPGRRTMGKEVSSTEKRWKRQNKKKNRQVQGGETRGWGNSKKNRKRIVPGPKTQRKKTKVRKALSS